MKIYLLLPALILLLCVPSCRMSPPFVIIQQKEQTYSLRQEQYFFPQLIDHYNYQNSTTWLQRFFVYDNYFDPDVGPVILYICGQAECRGISDQSYTAKIAQATHGIVLSLEHRYYGVSLPFGNDSFSSANLKFLSAEQALKDLAYFITQISKSSQFKIKPKHPWITIGGSYPGALAAWFRNKYPHLTIGSISSSGVVLAVEDFKAFDEQIYLSAVKSGTFCTSAIQQVTEYVEQQVTGQNKQEFRAQFNAGLLTAREFLFYWSDVIVFQVQYGNRVNFCNSLKNKTTAEQFEIIKALALKVTPVDYASYYLKNATWAALDGRGARSWDYQSCTQFSYFQTFSDTHPMRSKMLTIDFYRKFCDDIFGNDLWPYVNRVNNQFGGTNLNTDNLIMTNGVQDPWQWASLQKSTKKGIYAHVIDCDDCAHCVDLHAPNQKDAKDLTATRQYELQNVKKWIAAYWASL